MKSTAIAESRQTNLATLADQINTAHAACEASARTAIDHARRCGELLAEAKQHCLHGEWQSWLESNFDGSRRTAQTYMRVASDWPEIESKAQATALLTIEGAIQLLAEPRQSEPWRADYQELSAALDRLDAQERDPEADKVQTKIAIGKLLAWARDAEIAEFWNLRWLVVEDDHFRTWEQFGAIADFLGPEATARLFLLTRQNGSGKEKHLDDVWNPAALGQAVCKFERDEVLA